MILIPRNDKRSTHIINEAFTDKLGIFEIQSVPMVYGFEHFELYKNSFE